MGVPWSPRKGFCFAEGSLQQSVQVSLHVTANPEVERMIDWPPFWPDWQRAREKVDGDFGGAWRLKLVETVKPRFYSRGK